MKFKFSHLYTIKRLERSCNFEINHCKSRARLILELREMWRDHSTLGWIVSILFNIATDFPWTSIWLNGNQATSTFGQDQKLKYKKINWIVTFLVRGVCWRLDSLKPNWSCQYALSVYTFYSRLITFLKYVSILRPPWNRRMSPSFASAILNQYLSRWQSRGLNQTL